MITTKFINNTNINLSNPFDNIPTNISQVSYINQLSYIKKLYNSLYRYAPSIKFDVNTQISSEDLNITVTAKF